MPTPAYLPHHPFDTITNRINSTDYCLWLLVLLFYVTGDVLSTQLALTISTGHEANPLIRYIIHNHSWYALIAVKLLATTTMLLIWITGHYLLALGETKPFNARLYSYVANSPLKPLTNVLDTLSTLTARLEVTNTPSVSTATVLRLTPAIPAISGIFITINNILVAQTQLTLLDALHILSITA